MSRWMQIASLAVLAGLIGPATPARAQKPPEPAPQPSNAYSSTYLHQLYGAAQATPKGNDGPIGGTWSTYQPWTQQLSLYVVNDATDETLGASLEPLNSVLRTQLDLPADRGLIVTAIQPQSPAQLTGLHDNDILLTLADQPLAKPDDLKQQLKTIGERDVPLILLRAGQRQTITVRPVYRVLLGPAAPQKTEYYLGVAVTPVDDVLRAHVLRAYYGLGKAGLVVTEVVKDSPAEKAGIKGNDILLTFGGQPLDGQPALSKVVNAGKDKPREMWLLRGGKEKRIDVTPVERQVTVDRNANALRMFTVQSFPYQPTRTSDFALQTTPPAPAAGRLEALEKQIKALQKSLDEIRDLLKAGQGGAGGSRKDFNGH